MKYRDMGEKLIKSVVCYGAEDLRVEATSLPDLLPGQVRIEVAAGGICGSDLHYFNHGGFGAIRIKEPMILGHEISGHITDVAVSDITGDVEEVSVGDLVAVNPSRPCYSCFYCQQAMYNQCMEMRFYGSAMRFPHVQGVFSQVIVAEASQCFKLPAEVSPAHAACAEPLSVALSAIRKAGELMGKSVLVTGSGPIGSLVIAAAKAFGAAHIVATDIVDEALQRAKEIGADATINVLTQPDALDKYSARKGVFDVVIEASGNEAALRSALNILRPHGRLVLLGLGGDISLPLNVMVAKEFSIQGSFRFHEEFVWAVQLIAEKRIPLAPLLTHSFPVDQAVEAFTTANDRTKAMKVQLSFA